MAGCAFADARLGRRLRKLIERMDGAIGASLLLVCQDWANTVSAVPTSPSLAWPDRAV